MAHIVLQLADLLLVKLVLRVHHQQGAILWWVAWEGAKFSMLVSQRLMPCYIALTPPFPNRFWTHSKSDVLFPAPKWHDTVTSDPHNRHSPSTGPGGLVGFTML